MGGSGYRILIDTIPGRKEAVSDKLFSSAMTCSSESESQLSKGHTAAGLPLKTLSVKASI